MKTYLTLSKVKVKRIAVTPMVNIVIMDVAVMVLMIITVIKIIS